MGGPGGWRGLGESAFLADITQRDRDPGRIAATVIGGACVGLVAATACWVLVLVPYTFMSGLGGERLIGLGKVVVRFADPSVNDLSIVILRLVAATATDGIFWLAFVAMAATITSRPFQHYVTAALNVRWRRVLVGLILTAVAMSPVVVSQWASAPAPRSIPLFDIAPDWIGRALFFLSALLLVPAAAAAEELMFRGWLMHQLAAFTRNPIVLVVVNAFVFAAAHLDFSPDAFLSHALMGVGFSYMALRLGGIELSTGVHAANNLLVVLFVAQPGLKTAAGTGGFDFGDIAMVAGYVLITEGVVRLAPLRQWAGVRPAEIAPPLTEQAG
jgi:membrane protease YdiL (CAAX protease family)